MKRIEINPKTDLIFDLKVREMCKSCKRYTKKATCFPYVESMDYYRKLLPTYEKGVIYYEKFEVNKEKPYLKLGKESSLYVHRYILKERDRLFNGGHFFIVAFGAGSCKLCSNCQFPCKQPEKSLIPIEATGLNLVRVMIKQCVVLKFPIKDYFYRIGAVFYD